MELRALKTFYDQRHGIVEVEDDVLSVVRQVRQVYGAKITIHVDPDTCWYYFVEHCEDGTDRLVFTTPDLDARSLSRLFMGDSQSRVYEDPYHFAEFEQDRLQQERENIDRMRVAEAGERLHYALKKDGVDA